jgi:hypothetical protein
MNDQTRGFHHKPIHCAYCIHRTGDFHALPRLISAQLDLYDLPIDAGSLENSTGKKS